jgi:TPR repeat protein
MKRVLIMAVLAVTCMHASLFSDAMRAYKTGKFTEAKTLFEQALEEDGAVQASFFLGMLYLRGEGVEKNLEKARQYLQNAASNGNARAMCYLAEAYLTSKPADIQKAKQALRQGMEGGASECRQIASQFKISL